MFFPVLLDLCVHVVADASEELAKDLLVHVSVHLVFIYIDVEQLDLIFLRLLLFLLRAKRVFDSFADVFVQFTDPGRLLILFIHLLAQELLEVRHGRKLRGRFLLLSLRLEYF